MANEKDVCETCGGRALECKHRDGRPCAMDTAEMQSLYSVFWGGFERRKCVIGFGAPCVVVTRKSDGVKGSLFFDHSPRRYYGWTKA
jgi:hypothetical protein